MGQFDNNIGDFGEVLKASVRSLQILLNLLRAKNVISLEEIMEMHKIMDQTNSGLIEDAIETFKSRRN